MWPVIWGISSSRCVAHKPSESRVPPASVGMVSKRSRILPRSSPRLGIRVLPLRMPTAWEMVVAAIVLLLEVRAETGRREPMNRLRFATWRFANELASSGSHSVGAERVARDGSRRGFYHRLRRLPRRGAKAHRPDFHQHRRHLAAALRPAPP